MSLEEQIPEQRLRDGVLFRRLKDTEGVWEALERLMVKLEDDFVRQRLDDDSGKYSKKWLRGCREVCLAVVPTMDSMIQDAEAVLEEKKDLEKVTRSPAEDGGGSGDIPL